jgi:hypothetical protein
MYLKPLRLFCDVVDPKNFIRLAAMARRTRRTFAPCGAMLLLLSAGCSSLDKPASVSFASVILSNTYSVGQIRQATSTVFQQNGYQSVPQPDGALVFEREATRSEQISYAGLVGAQEGQAVIIQVRVKIEYRDSSSYWLGCKAYAVCNPGQSVFSTYTALFHFQSGPYQQLLNNVKGTLQRPAVTP